LGSRNVIDHVTYSQYMVSYRRSIVTIPLSRIITEILRVICLDVVNALDTYFGEFFGGGNIEGYSISQ